MQIPGRIVVVTGASSGIGEATAKAFAQKGGRVLLLARNQSALKRVAGEIKAHGGRAQFYAVDIADASAVERAAESIQNQVGTPDIIINNAGAGQWKSTEETSPEEAVQMMAAPYFGAFSLTRAFLPAMLKRRSGHIVNLTSVSAYFPMPGSTAYTAARWAMRGFNEALRADLHGTGIGVSLVAPGKVKTSYFQNNPGTEERIPKIGTLKLIMPTLTPEQVAEAIVRGVEKNRREIILPLALRLTVLMAKFWLRPLERLLMMTGPKRDQK